MGQSAPEDRFFKDRLTAADLDQRLSQIRDDMVYRRAGMSGAPDMDSLEWFENLVRRHICSVLPIPYIYPVDRSTMSLEWDLTDSVVVTVIVSLNKKTGELFYMEGDDDMLLWEYNLTDQLVELLTRLQGIAGSRKHSTSDPEFEGDTALNN